MKYRFTFFNKAVAAVLTAVFFLAAIPASSAIADPSNNEADSNSSGTNFTWPAGPSVYSDAAIVMEANSGLILYEKDIYTKYYPASITKILTTLLALENNSLSETMTMSREAEWDVDFDSSRIGLVEGEQLSMEDALYAVMLESANEVAYGVAEHVAKGTVSDFANMMNERAKELGCKNSNFVNPNGLHDDNHYTCAYDMALISRAAINIPEFRKITGSRTHQIPATNKNVMRYLANHHRFIRKTLTYDGAIGGKTGGTDEAKTTLVTFAERNGLTLIAVVLHTDTALHAYEDTAKILDFAFDNYSLYNIEQTKTGSQGAFASLFSKTKQFTASQTPILRISDNSTVILPNAANTSDAQKSVILSPVDEFLHGDNIIGQIAYSFEGKKVGYTDIIYYNSNYPLTKAEFESRWPSYLIPPNIKFADANTSTEPTMPPDNQEETVNNEKQPTVTKKNNIFPIIIGGIVAAVIIVIGLYVIFIEIPHRKRRKLYKERRKKRLESFSQDNNSE